MTAEPQLQRRKPPLVCGAYVRGESHDPQRHFGGWDEINTTCSDKRYQVRFWSATVTPASA